MRKTVTLRRHVFTVLLVSIIFLAVIQYIRANSEVVIESDSFQTGVSYVVFIDGSTVKARNAAGEIDYSGTNASQIINNAISNSEGVVHLASGTYSISASILLDNKTTIDGEGRSTHLQLATSANCDLITLKETNVELTTVRNLLLDGNNASNTQGCGIAYNQTESNGFTYTEAMHEISDVMIVNCAEHGIYLETQGCREIHITNVFVHGVELTGFKFLGGDHKLIDCVAGHCGHAGFDINGYGAHQLTNCKAYGNGWDGTLANRDGFYFTAYVYYVSLTNCYAQDNYRFGFTIAVNVSHVTLTGCIGEHNGLNASDTGVGLRLDGCDNVTVTGCIFDDRYTTGKTQDWGIYESNSSHVTTGRVTISNTICIQNEVGGIYREPYSTEVRIFNSINGTVPINDMQLTASYVVFKDGSYTCMQDGSTGATVARSTNASAIINACIGNLTSGGKIFIKAGTYTLDSQLNVTNYGITIEGEGSGVLAGATAPNVATVLKISHSGAGIYINPTDDADVANGHRISHLQIDGWGNAADGLKMTVIKSTFEDIIIRNCTYGLHIVGCAKSSFKDIYTRYNDYGVYVGLSPVRDMNFWEVYFSNLNDEYSDEVGFFANFTGATQRAQGLQIDRATIEIADKQGMILEYWYDVTLNRMHFETNNEDNLAQTYDLEIYSSHKIDINGLRADSANADGFKMDSVQEVSLDQAFVGTDTFNFSNCDHISAHVFNGNIDFDDVDESLFSGLNVQNSINLDSNCDRLTFTNGVFFVAATKTFDGTNLKFENIRNFVTENSGSATNTTATTFVFNHELAGTPTGVWASFNTTTVSGWMWTATSTQITITVAGSGLPSVIACYWKAEYVP